MWHFLKIEQNEPFCSQNKKFAHQYTTCESGDFIMLLIFQTSVPNSKGPMHTQHSHKFFYRISTIRYEHYYQLTNYFFWALNSSTEQQYKIYLLYGSQEVCLILWYYEAVWKSDFQDSYSYIHRNLWKPRQAWHTKLTSRFFQKSSFPICQILYNGLYWLAWSLLFKAILGAKSGGFNCHAEQSIPSWIV